jgi:cation transport regulator ChaC
VSTCTWVFGYGSLVSPSSLGGTLGRAPHRGVDFLAAECAGWERRWNYGYPLDPARYTGSEIDRVDTVVALGVVPAPGASVNGIVARVSADELARLDDRERHYDRVDVTDSVTVLDEVGLIPAVDRIVTYVPTELPLTRYREARDRGRAGIEIRYWNLVDGAFEALAPGHGDRYRATTPAPDVPVVDVSRID